MTVVSDTNEDGVIWLKCPRCKGILPHMEDAADAEAAAQSTDPLHEIDIEKAQPYDPAHDYAVGDVLHHRGWDDYGVVVEKDRTAEGASLEQRAAGDLESDGR